MTDRIRVKDKDTGHKRTIAAHMLPHGNYEVLKSDAVDPRTGEDVPPEYAQKPAEKSAEQKSDNGQKATDTKES